MGQYKQLPAARHYRTAATNSRSAKLGDVITRYIAENISPRQGQFAEINRVWSELVPKDIRRHCALDEVANGRLKILADSPSHLYRLRLLQADLIDTLAHRCPRAGIKKIKLSIGRPNNSHG